MFSIQIETRFWIIFNINTRDQRETWLSISAEFVIGERIRFLTSRIMPWFISRTGGSSWRRKPRLGHWGQEETGHTAPVSTSSEVEDVLDQDLPWSDISFNRMMQYSIYSIECMIKFVNVNILTLEGNVLSSCRLLHTFIWSYAWLRH